MSMKMNQMQMLPQVGRIDLGRLDSEFYVSSLLDAAVQAGLLPEAAKDRIACDFIALLAGRTERLTGGESSSVRVEVAQSLMDCNLFTIGVYLKSLPTPELAVQALLEEPVAGLYYKGRRRIDTRVKVAGQRHQSLCRDFFDMENEVHRDTVKGGIMGFFKRYDPDFTAQEIHITADYPLSCPVGRLAGIEFISAYLDGLICENTFCRAFPAPSVVGMLTAFHPGYRTILFNLFEQVLCAAVGCVLCGVDVMSLSVSASRVRQLQAALLCMTRPELGDLVASAVQSLLDGLKLPGTVQRYVVRTLPNLTASLAIAMENLTLDRIIPQAATG